MHFPLHKYAALLPVIIALILLTGVFAPLQAAEETVSVRAFTLSGSESPVLSLWNGETFQTVRASNVQPSPAYQVAMANPLPVYLDPQPGPEGEPPQPAAMVPLPEGATHILLLVTGNENQIVAMTDDLHAADARDWLFFNLTASTIAFQIGEDTEPILIEPRSRFSRRMDAGSVRSQPVMAAARIQGEVQTFYSTFWPIRDDRRTMVMFVPAGEDRIQLRRIVERLAPREEDE
ncbi:MAG: hypothetical protein JJU29_13410 [Verrucomicrobia bacterium]|nr:hypothetical protein [Verrucomicrobiota bacterium]MCH8514526.1 hypothetical protein [Kiritimatiellia bacterium]